MTRGNARSGRLFNRIIGAGIMRGRLRIARMQGLLPRHVSVFNQVGGSRALR